MLSRKSSGSKMKYPIQHQNNMNKTQKGLPVIPPRNTDNFNRESIKRAPRPPKSDERGAISIGESVF